MSTSYAYGESNVALERLGVVARMFEESSGALLDTLVESPGTALDLGCGPGHTTALLRRKFPAAPVVLGLDNSSVSIATARSLYPSEVRFEVCDVTSSRLCGAPADLIYSRFLLVHVPEPEQVFARWTAQLRPTGCVAVEEVEKIVSEDELFRAYHQVTTAPLRRPGREPFVGRVLARMRLPADTVVQSSDAKSVQPRVGDVARMFRLNMHALREHAAVRERFREEELRDIEERLAGRVNDDSAGAVTWTIRQVIVRRVDRKYRGNRRRLAQ